MDVGTELRQAREQHGLSLDELSQHTKIKIEFLAAIEQNENQRLPAGVFTRGFLQAYAREVGLDPSDVAKRFAAQFAPPTPPRAGTTDGSSQVGAANDQASADKEERTRAQITRRALVELDSTLVVPGIWVLAVVVAAFVLITVAGLRSPAPDERDTAPQGLVGSSPRESPSARPPVATTGSTTAGPSARAVDTLHVEFAPHESVWVSATADGHRVIYRLMNAGERQAIDVVDNLLVRVGEPAHFAFTINGASGRPLGPPGRPATARLTRQTYEQFLER